MSHPHPRRSGQKASYHTCKKTQQPVARKLCLILAKPPVVGEKRRGWRLIGLPWDVNSLEDQGAAKIAPLLCKAVGLAAMTQGQGEGAWTILVRIG